MGLSTTAVHAIWVVAILVGGGALGTTLLREAEETRQADEELLERGNARIAVGLELLDADLELADGEVRLAVRNTGRTSLDPEEVVVLFDGVFVPLASWEVDGVAGTQVFAPGSFANLTITAPWEPHRAALGGAGSVFWENPEPSRFVELTVSPDPVSVEFLDTAQFSASGTDQYGEPYVTQGDVTWTTDIAGSAIDADGLFTAGTTEGTGNVEATQGAVEGFAVVTVYRNPPVLTTMALSPSSASVEFLATQAFTATCYDQYVLAMACPALDWSTTVAGSAVDASGLFTAGTTVASGQVEAASGGVSATADVDVFRNAAVLTTIALSPSSASVEFLDTETFTAACADQYALAMACPALTWSTTVSGSSVSAAGVFTAGTTVASGVVEAANGGVVGSAAVDVFRNAAVLTSITVSPASASVEFLDTEPFTATCADQYALAMTCPTLTWTTTVSGSSVSSEGLFTAGTTVASGVVQAENGAVSDTSAVDVFRNAAVLTTVTLSPSSASVQATKTSQFTAACADQYALTMTCPTLTWTTTSSGSSVSSSGLFTAGTTLSTGATVRAQSGSVFGTSTVDVVALEVKVTWIKMFLSSTEQYSFRDTETAVKRAKVVAVLDGADVPNVSVTLVSKDPSSTTVDTDVATTSSVGEASGSYRPGQGAPLGTYSTEVTSVSAAWISWSTGVPPNDEIAQAYTVTD